MEVTDHGQASETGLPGSDHGALPQGGSSRQGEDTGRVLRRLRLPPQVRDPTAGAQEINFAATSPGRRPKYDQPQLLEALRRIWLASDQLCGKRLKVALPLWLPHYEAEHGALPGAVRAGLAASASTLDRLLKAARVAHPKGLSGTKPGTLLKKQIPIRCEHWDVSQPGFVEADRPRFGNWLPHCLDFLLFPKWDRGAWCYPLFFHAGSLVLPVNGPWVRPASSLKTSSPATAPNHKPPDWTDREGVRGWDQIMPPLTEIIWPLM